MRENHHETIDVWANHEIVLLIRVISRKTGHLYVLDVSEYRISADHSSSQEESMTKKKVFHLEKIHLSDVMEEEEQDIRRHVRAFDNVCGALPEWRGKMMLQVSNYILTSPQTIYKILHFPSRSQWCMYLLMGLDWFYDNVFTVSHQVDRFHQVLWWRTTKISQEFLVSYQKQQSPKNHHLREIQQILHRIMENHKRHGLVLQLFTRACQEENTCTKELASLGRLTTDHLRFEDTVRRSYQRKSLQQRLEKLQKLREDVCQEVLASHGVSSHFFLRFLYVICSLTILWTQCEQELQQLSSLLFKSS